MASALSSPSSPYIACQILAPWIIHNFRQDSFEICCIFIHCHGGICKGKCDSKSRGGRMGGSWRFYNRLAARFRCENIRKARSCWNGDASPWPQEMSTLWKEAKPSSTMFTLPTTGGTRLRSMVFGKCVTSNMHKLRQFGSRFGISP